MSAYFASIGSLNSGPTLEKQMTHDFRDDLITCEDAARHLAVSIRTLSRWARLRKGPPRIKVGRSIFYRRSAIEHWLLSLENG
ncbi:helix-turn-helix transcriptional regulator [Qipengyuania sp. NPDC077563]|uniref:helix-turn-helix transcriptional regulator n=1 Tax=Qipengyuania sp. NPDC077563 TaxID=3364497 RepID=UPI00384C02C4